MRFGAPVWPFKWDPPYEDALRRISGLGFRAVELIAWNKDFLTEYYTPSRVRSLRAILDDEDLVLSQFVSTPEKMASADPAQRRESIDHFKQLVDVGVELGAQVINSVSHYPFAIAYPYITDRPSMQLFTVDLPSGLNWEQNWLDYVNATTECAKYAETNGVRYSIEPHPFRYGGNTEGLLRLLDAVDSPALGVNLDPSHMFPVGDMPHAAVYRLGSRVVHCHFSDNDGTTNVHWRPGKGKIDWERLLRALLDTGYDGVISLEFEDIPGVSRGAAKVPGVYPGHEVATEEFAKEYQIALEYLTGLATDVGLKFE